MSTTPPSDPWGDPGSGNQPPPPPGGYPPPPPSWEQPPPSGGYGQPGAAYPPPPPGWQQPQQGYYGGGPAPAAGGQLAGWWQRVGATVVDTILLIVVFFILAAALKGFGVVLAIVLWAVYITMMLSRGGQTLGNKSVNTRVVDSKTGGPISAGKALGRWAAGAVLGAISIIGLLDVLWPLWDGENQTLHDKIAGTVVLRDQ